MKNNIFKFTNLLKSSKRLNKQGRKTAVRRERWRQRKRKRARAGCTPKHRERMLGGRWVKGKVNNQFYH